MVGHQRSPFCINNTMQNNDTMLSDARLIKIIHTFFELDDLKMSCNDMLTKVLSIFRRAIAKGGLQEVLKGFISFLGSRREKIGSHVPHIVTHGDLKILIAGLIKRFSNDRTLKEVLDSYDQNSIVDRAMTGGHNLRLNGNMLSMMDTAPYAGIRLLPPSKIIVLDPKQAAVLVFLFHTYYSNNTVIDDSSVRGFMATLEKIDESIHGSVSLKGSDFRPAKSCTRASLLAAHQGCSSVVQQYITGKYSVIFSMLNECFLRYDFLNIGRMPKNHPRCQTKMLLLNYLMSFMGLPSQASEMLIWSMYVNEVGAVTTLDSMVHSGALNVELTCYIILQSIILIKPPTYDGHASYASMYEKNIGLVRQCLELGKYVPQNPYDMGVTRKDDGSLNIIEAKLERLKELVSFLS